MTARIGNHTITGDHPGIAGTKASVPRLQDLLAAIKDRDFAHVR